MARPSCHLRRDSDVTHVATHDTVELRGFEPLTFCMPCSRVSSDDVALGPAAAVQSDSNVRERLARSGEIWGRWYLVWHWFCRTARWGDTAMAIPITDDMMSSGECLAKFQRPDI